MLRVVVWNFRLSANHMKGRSNKTTTWRRTTDNQSVGSTRIPPMNSRTIYALLMPLLSHRFPTKNYCPKLSIIRIFVILNLLFRRLKPLINMENSEPAIQTPQLPVLPPIIIKLTDVKGGEANFKGMTTSELAEFCKSLNNLTGKPRESSISRSGDLFVHPSSRVIE